MLMAFTFSVFWDNQPMFQFGGSDLYVAPSTYKRYLLSFSDNLGRAAIRRTLKQVDVSDQFTHPFSISNMPIPEDPLNSSTSSIDSASPATTTDNDNHAECQTLSETKILGFSFWAQYNCTKATAA